MKDSEDFAQWLLTDFQLDGATVMVAPADGFYATPGLGKDEVRIAYVLKSEDLTAACRDPRGGDPGLPGGAGTLTRKAASDPSTCKSRLARKPALAFPGTRPTFSSRDRQFERVRLTYRPDFPWSARNHSPPPPSPQARDAGSEAPMARSRQLFSGRPDAPDRSTM